MRGLIKIIGLILVIVGMYRILALEKPGWITASVGTALMFC